MSRALYFTGKDYSYLRLRKVEKWLKMEIYFYGSWKKFGTIRVKN